MVFYFTATGNSLYIAKQIEENPISIPKLMRQKKREFADSRIGIVSPVYSHEMPPMVKEFLKQSVFHTDYFFIILTYGSQHGGAAELAKAYCEECGISVQYSNVVLMADNWLPAFDVEAENQLYKQVSKQMTKILEDLLSRREMCGSVTQADREDHRRSLERKAQRPKDAWQHLIHVTKACIGCGICEKVCPADSILVVNGKAVHFLAHCQPCFACVHACPQKAIGLTVPEKNPRARYRNEHIMLREIIAANSGNT